MSNPLPVEDQPLEEFKELFACIARLPLHLRSKLQPLSERIGQFMHLQNKLIRISQEAIDDLQLENVYLRFDAEATRREMHRLHRLRDDQEPDSQS